MIPPLLFGCHAVPQGIYVLTSYSTLLPHRGLSSPFVSRKSIFTEEFGAKKWNQIPEQCRLTVFFIFFFLGLQVRIEIGFEFPRIGGETPSSKPRRNKTRQEYSRGAEISAPDERCGKTSSVGAADIRWFSPTTLANCPQCSTQAGLGDGQ